jgi:hypothetical protein
MPFTCSETILKLNIRNPIALVARSANTSIIAFVIIFYWGIFALERRQQPTVNSGTVNSSKVGILVKSRQLGIPRIQVAV